VLYADVHSNGEKNGKNAGMMLNIVLKNANKQNNILDE
tara:strand:+ start:469 stop:582 length:114 start_codon:yes stop_codon:yes gene_type:complete